MGEVIQFIPAPQNPDKANRAFWLGPKNEPEQDTAPCETPPYQAPEDGDCA